MKPAHKILCLSLILPCLFAMTASASSDLTKKLNAVDKGLFQNIDLNKDSKISRDEMLSYTDLVFLSMDSTGDDRLSKKEFMLWDPGYLYLAEQSGRSEAFNKAKLSVFVSRDLNADGTLEHDEFSTSTLYDFYKADKDGDRHLSESELLNEYFILNNLRAVFK